MQTYTPQSGSVASKVLAYFHSRPDAELDLDALEAKFGKSRSQSDCG